MTIQDKIPKNKPYRINEMQVGDTLFTVVSIESDSAREHLYDKVKRMIQFCCLILFKLQLCRRLRILRRSRIVVLQQLAYLAVTRQEHDCPCADLRIDVIVCNAPNQHLIVLSLGYNAGLDKVLDKLQIGIVTLCIAVLKVGGSYLCDFCPLLVNVAGIFLNGALYLVQPLLVHLPQSSVPIPLVCIAAVFFLLLQLGKGSGVRVGVKSDFAACEAAI